MITAPDSFHRLANGSVRPLDWNIGISFTKERNEDIGWFTLNSSALDGGDLLASDLNNPIQLWDSYEYMMLKERLISLSITRSVQFPYNVQSGVADFELNNYGGSVKSEALIEALRQAVLETGREFIFNDEFILYLKEENKEKPYFALKVDNTDVLISEED